MTRCRPSFGSRSTGRPNSFSRVVLQSEIGHAEIISWDAHVEQVNIAIRPRIPVRNRPEDGQLRNAVLLAQFSQSQPSALISSGRMLPPNTLAGGLDIVQSFHRTTCCLEDQANAYGIVLEVGFIDPLPIGIDQDGCYTRQLQA